MARDGRGLLILHDSPDFGGHERIFLRLLPRLLERGDFDRVVLRHAAANTRLAAALAPFAGAMTVVTGAHQAGRAGPWLARWRRGYAREVRALFADHAPERALIVQGRIESATVPVIAAPREAMLVSYLPMAHPRATIGPQPFGEAVRRPFYRRIDRFVVPSLAVAAQLAAAGARGDVRVVGNSVSPPPHPGRAAARAALGIAADARIALLLCRLDVRQKGIDTLLAAIARDRAALAGWQLRIVGSGEGEAMVARAAADGLVSSLSWTNAPHLQLAAADVLLLPSRWEGVPLVALEAMAYHVPVLGHAIAELAALLPPANITDFRAEPLSAALARVTAADARAAFAAHADRHAGAHRPEALAEAFADAVAG